jgi:hypothetical protein
MDRITDNLLAEFSKQHGIEGFSEDRRFEHFCSYITVRRHFGETFDTADVVTTIGNESGGNDTGIDGIAILVNGVLVTDVDVLSELSDVGYLDVTFVFVQADRSSSFDGSKIGTFGFGVGDFFNETPSLPRNTRVAEAAEIMRAIYDQSSKFKRGNPVCRLYFATTGKLQDDPNLEGRRSSVEADLSGTQLFRDVEFVLLDAADIQKLYQQTQNAISREFLFSRQSVLPDIPGVERAYLGILPGSQFLKIVTDDSGDMLSVLFYDNVRDWLDFNTVNDEIKKTIVEDKQRFVLMNNGVTIIARNLQRTGDKFLIEDYSIVNGCQSSHVLFDQRELVDDAVNIPVRLIGTQDEDVINAIIRATNRQTPVSEEQFYALEEFSKSLERYFQTYDGDLKLYYERRTHQYDRLKVEKTRIVTPANVIKAFAGMFLGEAHRTTRNYRALKAQVGTGIFAKGHRLEPYYTASLALYKLEYLFRSGRIESKFKPARFHILLAARILANPAAPPELNATAMDKYAKGITQILSEAAAADDLLGRAARVVNEVAAGNYDRDTIRTEPFTQKVVAAAMAQAGASTGTRIAARTSSRDSTR